MNGFLHFVVSCFTAVAAAHVLENGTCTSPQPTEAGMTEAPSLLQKAASIQKLTHASFDEENFQSDGQMPNCSGPVQQNLLFGCDANYSLATQICCNNTQNAESKGFFESAGGPGGLFSQLDASGTTTFYDSVCGVPVFIAPVGRSVEAWKAESQKHGWLSFRRAERVVNNIIIRDNGEVRSVCGTHLGQNLQDSSGDRYCINLVCIAGTQNTTM